MKTIFIVREGKFYSGGWKLNTDFAFTSKDDLHTHMEQVNGFKCELTIDQYSKKDTRFTNKEHKYGYDIVELNVFEAKKEVHATQVEVPLNKVDIETHKDIAEFTVQVTGLQEDSLRGMAKDEGVKSWHLKSRDKLIEEVTAKLIAKGFKVE